MFDLMKNDFKQNQLNDEQVFQKYLIDAETYFFNNIWANKDEELMMRAGFSVVMDVNLNDIVIIGSGKTGVSLKPGNVGRKFDEGYKKTGKINDKSDIDIAVISSHLYEKLSRMIFSYTQQYKMTWDSNSYYESGKEKFGFTLSHMFIMYLARGWFRPDLLPPAFKLASIETEKQKWRKKFERKVSFGIYKDWHYFKSYHIDRLQELRSKIATGELI